MKLRHLALSVLFVLPLAGPALADARQDVLVGIARCGGVASDHDWLDCLYGAAQPMRTKLGLAPAPQAARAQQLMSSAPPPPPAQGARSGGGFFSGLLGSDSEPAVSEQQFGAPAAPAVPADVKHVVSRMTAYKFDKYGIFTVTLANGQVWHQESGDTTYARWRDPAASYSVDIERGFMGSFTLHVANAAGGYKVMRVK